MASVRTTMAIEEARNRTLERANRSKKQRSWRWRRKKRGGLAIADEGTRKKEREGRRGDGGGSTWVEREREERISVLWMGVWYAWELLAERIAGVTPRGPTKSYGYCRRWTGKGSQLKIILHFTDSLISSQGGGPPRERQFVIGGCFHEPSTNVANNIR